MESTRTTPLSPIPEDSIETPWIPQSTGVVTTTISSPGADPHEAIIDNLRNIGFDLPQRTLSRSSKKKEKNPQGSPKEKKSRGFIASIRKQSSNFFGSLKPTERVPTPIPGHHSDLGRAFRLPWSHGARLPDQKVLDAIAEVRKLQDRGVEWWSNITRKTQQDLIYNDSFTDLMHALQRAPRRIPDSVDIHWYKRDDEEEQEEEEGDLYFRCDVHAVDATDFAGAYEECKNLVTEVGGKILGEYEYIGGFMYSLPATFPLHNPLADGDETLHGGHITITPWTTPFHPPQFDNFSPNNPEAGIFDVKEGETRRWPRVTPAAEKRRVQNWLLQQRIQADQMALAEEAKKKEEEAERETDDDDGEEEVVLSPRILDAGVELAILDPGRLMTTASEMALPVREEGEDEEEEEEDDDDEVEYDEDEVIEYGVARVVDLRGAVRGRAKLVDIGRR